ncbi:MAG: hypothetical protein M3Q75_07725 [Gemmatimonadota bacterium]|nr:hypothetical protein [Gemmatimonadota bacterium]
MTTDDIEVTVKVSGFTVDCAKARLPDQENVGHIHVMLDGMTMAQLTNFYCEETFTISWEGLEPGANTLAVELATNTHLDLMDTAQEVEIDYQPANPWPLPEGNWQGVPGVELVSPSDGATVPPVFAVEVKPVNFSPSLALEGKPSIPGYGHWHVFVDTTDPMALMEEAMIEMESSSPEGTDGTPEGDMGDMHAMLMSAMVAMPGTNTFELDLIAWGPGEHTIFIEPVQNGHTNFEEFEPVVFTVTVDEAATPAA